MSAIYSNPNPNPNPNLYPNLIGQIMYVFETEKERDIMALNLTEHLDIGFDCLPSGLTPPMYKIIERKWQGRFTQKGPFRKESIAELCRYVMI
jgi:hypothetical protein